jgi:hypothetical protein
MADPGADGFMVRTAVDTSTARTLTSPLGTLAVGNATGVAGNPTFDVDTSIIGQFSSGAGTAPATCVQGDFYLETDTGFVTACPATDTPNTLIGKAETSTAGYGFVIDEDSFASDLATKVPTQQSTKAYVAAQIGAIPAGSSVITPTSFLNQTEFNAFTWATTSNVEGWAYAAIGGCTAPALETTHVDDHPGIVEMTTNTTDNQGCAVYGPVLNGTTVTGSEWTADVIFRPEDAITDSYLSVGLESGSGDAVANGIRARYDTDRTDATWIFQICNANSAAGCDATGDDANSKVVASTIAPVANTWQRFRARRVESGVGGIPTIYMRMNDENERTFCAAGCDDDLSTLPTTTFVLSLSVVNRTTTSKRLQGDYASFNVTSGLVRY